MTFKELKAILETLSEEQLQQEIVVFESDDEYAKNIQFINISEEDIYWEHHGDCLGNIDEAKEQLGDDWENEKDDLIIVKKGTVTINII